MRNKVSMVVTRTPLRVSFMGGGTDFPDFYEKNGRGAVISLALGRYIYVVVKRHAKIFDEKYRISYSKTEVVQDLSEIENNVIRESLAFSDIQENLFVSTFSDIPAASGLGSSSALTVGLVNALHAFKRENVTRHQLAEEACEIEINRLGQPIGKQDQYAAAFGGLNLYEFLPDDIVNIRGLKLPKGYIDQLLSNASLYWTGLTRNVETILTEQKSKFQTGETSSSVKSILNMVVDFKKLILLGEDPIKLAKQIDLSWQHKKMFSRNVSNPIIENYYESAKKAGAYGGKICGGGGGGFLLLFHPPELREKIMHEAGFPFHLKLNMDFSGTEILTLS